MTMNVSCRKHYRKQQAAKAAKQRKAKEAQAVQAMYRRAYKSRAGTRLDVTTMSPRQKVEALTDYVNRLEVLRDDLRAEFDDLREFSRAARWLSAEIGRGLEAIVKASIELEAAGG